MFDPWGAVTMVQDGAGNNLTHLTFFDRGYTGHEHLQSVGLINMNARLYNPALHRFLEADNYLRDPSNTQNYNRYGYCLNNPLKYNDLDGNNPMILIGIAVAVLSYVAITASNHQKITVGGITNSILWGFMGSAVSFGVGEVTQSIGTFALEATTAGVLHGVTQGALTSIQGGKFWNTFAAGSLSSLAASAWTGVSGSFGQSAVGTIAFGTIAGGAGSYLTGGNFWEGSVTGMFVSGFNHALHDDEDYIQERPNKKIAKKIIEEYRRGNIDNISDWLDEHPFVFKDDKIYLKGIEECYVDISGQKQDFIVEGEKTVINHYRDKVIDKVIDKVFGKGVSAITTYLSDGGLAKEPTPQDRKNYELKIDMSKQTLLEYFFRPTGRLQLANMNNKFNPYTGYSRYELYYKAK